MLQYRAGAGAYIVGPTSTVAPEILQQSTHFRGVLTLAFSRQGSYIAEIKRVNVGKYGTVLAYMRPHAYISCVH